jgi:nucleolin
MRRRWGALPHHGHGQSGHVSAVIHAPSGGLPLLSSCATPLHLRATRRFPLAPLIASSDAVEAGVEWTESGDEAKAEDAFEEVGEEEGELVASGEEDGDLETDYLMAVEPLEEAKVYIGNLPYDVDREGLAQLFEQAASSRSRR